MNIFQWLMHPQSVRGAVLLLYKRGLAKGKKHNQQGAMDDYTAVIDMPDVPADVRAMALYNRALLYAGKKDFCSATDDLKAVLAMELPIRDIKSAARRTLDRMQRQQGTPATSPSDAVAST
jgi:hypothetical protein